MIEKKLSMIEKNEKLGELLHKLVEVIVAFSAGIDSTFVLARAKQELGDKVLAVTAVSETFPERELNEAINLAKLIGVRHEVIQIKELENANFVANNPDRCYHCKTGLYACLTSVAKQKGIPWILDGANMDDLEDYRPGRRAAKEYRIRSVLQEVEIYKDELRLLSKEMGLKNWDKPSFACLSSRIPYGSIINLEKIGQLDRGESKLRELGFHQLRIRHYDKIARIEVPPAEFQRVLDAREKIVNVLKCEGFVYVTLDLQGYRSGSMNETLEKNSYRQGILY